MCVKNIIKNIYIIQLLEFKIYKHFNFFSENYNIRLQ